MAGIAGIIGVMMPKEVEEAVGEMLGTVSYEPLNNRRLYANIEKQESAASFLTNNIWTH